MKQSLLTVLVCALFSSLSAQYVITKQNAPKAGDVYEEVADTLPQVSKGGSGANQTWDFTNLDFDVTTISEWKDAATAPDAADFPEAELYIDGMFIPYFDVRDDKLELIGIAGDLGSGRTSTRFSNPETALVFPSAYQSAYKDTSAYRLTFPVNFEIDENTSIDSARVNYNSRKDVSFDAWGTITTPLATFANSLRERAYTITTNETEIYLCVVVVPGFPKQCSWVDAATLSPEYEATVDTNVIYTWYNSALSNPIASITYDKDETTPVLASFNNDALYNGIGKVEKAAGVVYPNPASDVVYFKGLNGRADVSVSDVTGKVVKATAINGNSLDIADLEAGNYVITIKTENGISTDKLTVIK